MGGDGANGVQRQQGHVKWFDATKGWGFAQLDEGSEEDRAKDVFLHINCLPEGIHKLEDGQSLSFVVERTRKGPRATNVLLGD